MKNLKLTEEEVRHVGKLANLSLTSEEIKKFQKQLSQILDYVGVLQELDTGRIEPTSQVTGLENVLREDETSAGLTQEETLSGTANKQRGLFKVKAILSDM